MSCNFLNINLDEYLSNMTEGVLGVFHEDTRSVYVVHTKDMCSMFPRLVTRLNAGEIAFMKDISDIRELSIRKLVQFTREDEHLTGMLAIVKELESQGWKVRNKSHIPRCQVVIKKKHFNENCFYVVCLKSRRKSFRVVAVFTHKKRAQEWVDANFPDRKNVTHVPQGPVNDHTTEYLNTWTSRLAHDKPRVKRIVVQKDGKLKYV